MPSRESAAFNRVATSPGKLLPPPPAPLRERLLRTPACPPPQLRPGTVRLRRWRPGPAYPSPFSLHKWQFGWELGPLIPFTNPDSCSVLTLTPGQWQGERGTAPKAVERAGSSLRWGAQSPCANLAGPAHPDPLTVCTCVYIHIVDLGPVASLAEASSIQRCSDLLCLALPSEWIDLGLRL